MKRKRYKNSKKRWENSDIKFLTDGSSLKWEFLALYFQSRHRKGAYCWEWKGSTDGKGYGLIHFKNKNYSAHRVSYELFVGPIPKKAFICHTCDNPSCVNPAHLYPGTPKDNAEDMMSRRRHASQKLSDKLYNEFLTFIADK